MTLLPEQMPLRIARPSRDLHAAQRFWGEGVGLEILGRVEDLLVLYLNGQIDEAWLDRIVAAGGQRVESRNPYWDKWGTTILDPDGYRLVLSTRGWGQNS